jgi:aldehyde dehydrogenase (NAD+)
MRDLIARQRSYFLANATKPIAFRIAQLVKLRAALLDNEELIDAAIAADVGKSRFENLLTELYIVHDELNAAISNLEAWASTRPVKADPLNAPADCYVVPEPLGVSLVIGPWNYPFQLTLAPLVAAMAAGCTAIVKPSELMPHSSAALAEILGKAFEPQYVAVVEGGIPETTALLEQKFDSIFFTGSVPVGKIVYAAAAKNLTPVTLELGGKSPVIVMPDADLALTARRIVWGKFLNAGQTCIAPDYVYVHASVEGRLLEHLAAEIRRSDYDVKNGNYVRVVNARNVSRLSALIDAAKVYVGGKVDVANRVIEPTVLRGVTWDDRVMQEEIFGPILPVLTFESVDDVVATIKSRAKPLALYLFTTDAAVRAQVLGEVSFGGGCVNDTIMHITNGLLPFGGVGDSGIGRYHGEDGFKAFSHYKSIVAKGFDSDVELKYPPYTSEKLALMSSFIHPAEAK